MKACLQYLIHTFLIAGILIALGSCLPCAHCYSPQCAPVMKGHFRTDKLAEFAGFSHRPKVIPLMRKALHEVSGIAASLQHKGLLYLHEDSGHPNRLFLTNEKGE